MDNRDQDIPKRKRVYDQEMHDSFDTAGYFEKVKSATDFISSNVESRPKVLIICGSGLGVLCDYMQIEHSISYDDIPNVPTSEVVGHHNMLVFGKIKGVPVVVMKGRVHFYEGYPMRQVVFLIRCLNLFGVKTVLLTSAVGAINMNFEVGDAMVIVDHINLPGLCGSNPLIGANDERIGTRFPVMAGCYDTGIQELFKLSAEELGFGQTVRKGIMIVVGGPTYETPAEIRMLRMLGGDTVGMSIGPEVVSARHCGMFIFGVNLVTNKCSGILSDQPKEEVDENGRPVIEQLHRTVVDVSTKSSDRLSQIFVNMIGKLPDKYAK